jgi:MoaA/NifB/PqqE/SkfB family radical SAM enzyme
VTTQLAWHRKFDRLVLSGGEVTTFDDLERYIRFAASLGWFKIIQIQTNGRRLSDKRYLERLVNCGVNEFFVSIHGLAGIHDAITRAPGSFKEVETAFSNLESFDVGVISNTVLTKKNYNNLQPLVAYLAGRRIQEIQIWNFFPMEKTDSNDLVVSMRQFQSLLGDLTPLARMAGKPLVFKSFPHCLSIEPPGVFDSTFPATVLPDIFWKQFEECGFGRCVYRDAAQCDERRCWGLSSAYREKYGNERELLKPIRSRC